MWTGDQLFELMDKTDIPSYNELVDELTQNETRKNMMDALVKYGVCWLRGTPSDHSATVKAAKIFSCEQPNVFGTDWSFTADGARADSAYSTIGIGLHTDASYYCQPMGIQIFHVLEHRGNGGETMLSDGFSALKTLSEQDQDAFKFLTEYNLRHEYKENGQPGHHLHSVGSVIGK